MKILKVRQNSPILSLLSPKTNSYYIWENGEKVKKEEYPLALDDPRKKTWVSEKTYPHSFEELCEMFPDDVVDENYQLTFGIGLYKMGPNGEPQLWKGWYDSSD